MVSLLWSEYCNFGFLRFSELNVEWSKTLEFCARFGAVTLRAWTWSIYPSLWGRSSLDQYQYNPCKSRNFHNGSAVWLFKVYNFNAQLPKLNLICHKLFGDRK